MTSHSLRNSILPDTSATVCFNHIFLDIMSAMQCISLSQAVVRTQIMWWSSWAGWGELGRKEWRAESKRVCGKYTNKDQHTLSSLGRSLF